MEEKKLTNREIEELVDEIAGTYEGDSGVNFIDTSDMLEHEEILKTLDLLYEILFPGYTGKRTITKANIKFAVGDLLCQVIPLLTDQVERAFRYRCSIRQCEDCDCRTMAENVVGHLLRQLPAIRGKLKGDVVAAYDGDPAAQSVEEIVLSYPCIIAVATYRIAHELYLHEVPLIPRIMTESAHSRTGIDIHPGAEIGNNFFIDHGTGVVIGETTVIGDNVKIYQGATLGALSFPKDERGRIIKGQKRHPTIEDGVTIYAEATILGNVTIGRGAVVGGNVWVKQSVPPGFTVVTANADIVCTNRKGDGDSYEI